MSPMILIGAAALALLAGTALGYLMGSSGRRKESERAGALRAELDDYRREVTEHFSITAAHFRAIGGEYRKLYDHMAAGAAGLCEPGRSGAPVMFEPVERLTREVVTGNASPPRDYHVDDANRDDGDAADLETGDSAIDEPTDAELAETEAAEAAEAAEELVAERELAVDEVEADKTLH